MSKMMSASSAVKKSLGAFIVIALVSLGFVTPAYAGYNNTVTVKVHYNRATVSAASDFQGWYAYTFNTSSPGSDGSASDNPKWTQFAATDTYGGVATISLNAGASGNLSKIGIIITDRATWTGANKDSQSGNDRFINITSQSSTEVWMNDANTTISTSDPKSPANPVLNTFKFHYDGSAAAVHVAARTKAFNNTLWLNGAWLKFDGTTPNTTIGTDNFGKWVQYTLPYYTGQMDALFMAVGNTDWTGKDGGNAGGVSGNRWIATTGATNAASSDVYLFTGDSTSWSGNAAFASNPYGASAPTVTSVTNATVGSGSTGKAGDTLTIAGTNLVPSNAIPARTSQPTVTIGGATATVSPAPAASATAISVIVPAGLTAGAKDVVVTNASGSVTSTGGFTVAALPTITSLSSTTPVRGQSITVNGTNLTSATFTVGGVAATVATPNATAPVITVPTSAPVAAGSVVATTIGGSASTSVTVTKGTPTLTSPIATAINAGSTLASSTLSGGTATVNGVTVTGTFAWTTPTAIPTAGTGSYSVTFTPTDSTGFNSNTTTASVEAGKTSPTITATPAAGAISYGQTLTSSSLTGGSASVAGTFAFTTPTAAPTAGTANQSVTFTPTDTATYNTVVFNVSVTVNKATPTVTATPVASAITYGSTLSSATLSGGATTVAGSFAYASPGTTPGAGTANQSVTFTPTDTANYNSVPNIQVSVTVNKATPTLVAPTSSALLTGQSLSSSILSGGSASSGGSSVAGTFAWTNGATVPPTGTGSYGVTFTPTDTGNYNTNSVNVSVTSGLPTITSLSASSAKRGDSLTINGTNLSSSTVTIGGTSAVVSSNTSTAVTVTVPTSLAFGSQSVVVTNVGGSATDSSFSVAGYSTATLTVHYNKQSFTNINTYLHSWIQTGTGTTSGISVTGSLSTQSPETSVDDLGYDSYGGVAKITYTGSNIQQVGFLVWTQSGPFVKDGGSGSDRYRTLKSANDEIWIRNYDSTVSDSDPFSSINPNPNRPTTQSVTIHYDGDTSRWSKVYLGTRSDLNDTAVAPYSYWVQAKYLDFTTPVTITGPSGSSTTTVGTDAFGKYVTYTFPYNANHTTWANMVVGNQGLSDKDGGQASTNNRYAALDASGTTDIWLVSGDTSSNGGNAAYTSNPFATPVVSSLSATTGKAGDSLTVTGTGLKPQAGSNPTVTIGGISASVTSASATSVVVTVPEGLTSNEASAVVVSNAGGTSNSNKTFTKVAAPSITSLSANSGVRGAQITITGTDLTGASSVVFGSTSASSYTVNSATSITVTVPSGVANGLQNVAVTTVGGTATSIAAFTVNKTTPSVTATPSAAEITYGQTLASATLSGGSGSVPGTFAYATATAAPNAGTADQSVVFTPSDTTTYSTVSLSVSVTVNKATPTVTTVPSASAITYGQTLTNSNLTGGSVSVAGSWSWSDSTVAPNAGTANQTAVFTPTVASNYNTVERSVSVVTNKATASVTITGTSATYTGSAQSVSTETTPSGLTVDVTYEGSSTAPTAAGSYAVSATINDANYSGSKSGTLVIAPATVDVTWPTSSEIRNPAPLSTSSLIGGSAAFNGDTVEGTFAWATPTAVPTAGVADYSVKFVPTSANFAEATNSVSLSVLQPYTTAPTVGIVSQSGLVVSADITPATGTSLKTITVKVDGQSRTYSVSSSTYSVTLSRSDIGSSVVFSASAIKAGSLESDTTSSDAFTVTAAAAPTTIDLSQSGLDVVADIQLAASTSLGTVTAQVGTGSAFVVTPDQNGRVAITLTRSDKGKAVVFSATATQSGKAVSDTTYSSPITFGVANAPTFGSVSQSGLTVSVDVDPGQGQSVANVTATVDGSTVSVSNSGSTYTVTLARTAIAKDVVFTAVASATGVADSTSASTDAYTVLVAAAPTFGAVTQNELVVSAKVNLGGDQTYGTVTASVDGGDAQATTDQGDGLFSITLSKAQIGKAVVFSASAAQSGRADSNPAYSVAYTLVKPNPQLSSLDVDYGIRGASITATGNYLLGGTIKVGDVSASTTSVTDTSITFTVPNGAVSGTVSVVATTDSGSSSGLDFTVADAPTITGFASWMGASAPYVTNRGRSFDIFGTNLNGASFTVGGVPVSTVKSGETVVRVMLPADANLGTNQAVVATTTRGGASNTMYIDVIEHLPVITGFSATTVRPGDLVTIYGNWLGATNLVRFYKTGLTPTTGLDAVLVGAGVSITETSVTVRVPIGTLTGVVKLGTPTGFVNSTDRLSIYPVPKITSMKVGAAVVDGAARGATVSLAGLGFINGSVTIGGVSAQIAASPAPKDTAINVVVPNGITPGALTNLVVTSQYGVPSAPLSFTVGYDKPVINSLSVTAGALGSLLTINGKDFTGTSSVKFNSNKLANLNDPATVITDTAVTVKVPTGAITGVITLTSRGGSVTSSSFTVYQPPTLTTILPNVAKAGSIVAITGTNLTGATFQIGGVVASPAPSFVATATTARVVVPAGAALSSAMGDSTISVTTLGGTANVPFTVVAAPAVSSLSSSSAVVGTDITINGSNLLNPTASPSASAISVKIGGVAATVQAGATLTKLVVTVPLSATVGSTSVSITTLGGTVATGLTVVPLAPTVSSLSVSSQNRGKTVVISGTNLLRASVTIGGVTAAVSSGATATAMTVTVPDSSDLGSQQIVVTTAGGADSTKSITVKTQLPSVTTVAQTGTKRGVGTVTVTGTFFAGATVKVGTVTVASSALSINGGGTSLTFTIPATAVVNAQTNITITNSGGSWLSTTSAQKIAVTSS